MKKWNMSYAQAQAQEQQKAVDVPSLPLPLPLPSINTRWFQCLSCGGGADVLFDGTSYCRGCLKEKLRVGSL